MFPTACMNSGSSHTGSTHSVSVRAGFPVERTVRTAISSPLSSTTPVTDSSVTWIRATPEPVRISTRAPRAARSAASVNAAGPCRQGERPRTTPAGAPTRE